VNEDLVSRLIFQCLNTRPSSEDQTADFGSKHHNDDLCPAMERAMNDILRLCRRNFNIAYDIQGIQDSGVDVLVRLSDDEDQFIAVQIKADNELPDSNLLKTLKAQHFDATNKYEKSLLHYYIAPFADLTQSGRRDRVRLITSTFARTQNVTVLSPQTLWSALYGADTESVELAVATQIYNDDPLVRESQRLCSVLTPVQRRVVVSVLANHIARNPRQLTRHDLVGNEFIISAARRLEMQITYGLPFWFFIPKDLELELEGGDSEVPSADDFYAIGNYVEIDEMDRLSFSGWSEAALVAIGFDGSARFELSEMALARYLDDILDERRSDREWEWRHVRALGELAEDVSQMERIEVVTVVRRLLEVNWNTPSDAVRALSLQGLLRTRVIESLQTKEFEREIDEFEEESATDWEAAASIVSQVSAALAEFDDDELR
jgi:hypothetical protein